MNNRIFFICFILVFNLIRLVIFRVGKERSIRILGWRNEEVEGSICNIKSVIWF